MNASLPTRREALAIGLAQVGACAAPAFASPPPAADFDSLPKAAWVWGYRDEAADGLATFAGNRRISPLFVSLAPLVRRRLVDGDAAQAERFRVLARGGRVWALAGDPSWVNRPDEIPGAVRDILAIQRRFGLFDGLHLDVEPHVTARWRSGASDQAAMAGDLVRLLKTISDATSLPIEAALHPSLAAIRLDRQQTALRAACRVVSAVSIMAYRDRPEDAVRWAASALDQVREAKVAWRMGVLVHETHEPHTGYDRTPVDQFVTAMSDLDRLLKSAGNPMNYRGLAFEDLAGLRGLMRDKA